MVTMDLCWLRSLSNWRSFHCTRWPRFLVAPCHANGFGTAWPHHRPSVRRPRNLRRVRASRPTLSRSGQPGSHLDPLLAQSKSSGIRQFATYVSKFQAVKKGKPP